MSDAFHSFEGTANGISIKVGTHRRAIGVGDYDTKAEFIAAAAGMLEGILGKNLALVAANVAAAETDGAAKIAALKAEHAEEVAILELAIETLGTKEEAAEMRKAQQVAAARAKVEAAKAELAKLLPADLEATDDAEPIIIEGVDDAK